MTSSIANETVDHSKNREPFSFYKFITNKYFLNVVSIVLFLALWDYVAKEKIFRDSLARPLEVVDQLYRLTYMKFAGTNLIGHIWASTQRVLIGFIAASVVAVPLGLFMALNKYVNAIVKPLFDLFKPAHRLGVHRHPVVRHRRNVQGVHHHHRYVRPLSAQCIQRRAPR